MRRNFLVTFLSLYLISCTNNDPVSTQINTIEGSVSDAETGSALSGVTISTDPTTQQTNTNGEGQFVIDIDVKPEERYRVNASKQGYIPNFAELTARAGKNRLTSDIVLQKEKPLLGVSPTTLDFGISKNSLPLIIENIGGKLREFTWVLNLPNESWITADKTTGHITNQTQVVNISVNRTGLDVGNKNTKVVVTADNDAGSKTIDIIMTVPNPNAPQMSVNKINVDFGDSQSFTDVQVTNTGTGTLEWMVTSNNPNWLTASPSRGACNSGETKSFNITAQRMNLNSGPHQGTIIITSNGTATTNTHIINVKLSITASPFLDVSPDTLDFGKNVTQMSFGISNIGEGTLEWALFPNKAWISLSRSSGINNASVGVTITRSGLDSGPHFGQIRIQWNNGFQDVLVSMENPTAVVNAEKEPNDDASQAYQIASDDLVDGNVGVGNDKADWFKIPILNNGRLWFTIKNNNSGANPGNIATSNLHEEVGIIGLNLLVYATLWQGGNNYYIRPGQTATSPSTTVSRGQTYFVEVPRYPNHAASYRLNVAFDVEQVIDFGEPNSFVEPFLIQENGDFKALIGFEKDSEDWYLINFPSNGFFQYKLTNLNPASTNYGGIATCFFYLRNGLDKIPLTSITIWQGGNNYFIHPDGAVTSASIAVSQYKDYCISIPRYSTNHSAPYRLQYGFTKLSTMDIGEPNDSSRSAYSIKENGTFSAIIGYQSDIRDWYKVVMPAKGEFEFSLTNQHAAGVNSGRIASTALYDESLKKIATITKWQGGSNYYFEPVGTAKSNKIPVAENAVYFIEVPKYEPEAAPYQIQTYFVRN